MTLATPHCGSRRIKGNWMNEVILAYTNTFTSITGSQLLLEDDKDEPLLLKMSEVDSRYVNGLKMFERKILYGNIANDFQVPFCTAMICTTNPFGERGRVNGNLKYDSKYRYIITDAKFEDKSYAINENSFKSMPERKQILCSIVQNLNTLKWERIFIHVESYFWAHEYCIAKRLFMDDSIVQHICDSFILKQKLTTDA